ncbi:MAG: flagellar basal body P-ring protein FlgI [Verrucomicrobia bacterium]|nr:flagellar basal body P-ring protein FlgI [Verrucomicrobiota bacterium]
MNRLFARILLVVAGASAISAEAAAVRVRDLTFVHGARDNQLVGYGMVYGLANDGDKDPIYTKAAFGNTLRRLGITVPADAISSKNVAAVIVTADIAYDTRSGNRINVNVAAAGDAKSLQGGVLAMTPLQGVDGEVYAVAQGALAVGGFALGQGGGGGATVQKNHPTTATIIGGALVEREIPVTLVQGDAIQFVLREPDFTTAARMAQEVNSTFPGSSHAVSGTTVRVKIPDNYQHAPVDFIARVQAVEVTPDTPARVIVNERTGTVVVTARTKVSSCAITHGNLVVKIAETLDVSQPSPFAQVGQTAVVPRTETQVAEQPAKMKAFPEMPTVEKIAASLNELGATPRDVMAILEAMQQAGALQAELLIR